MAEVQGSVPPSVRSEPGHLTVKLEGLRPPELIFEFERQPKRMGGALGGSVAAHAFLGILALLMTLYGPDPQYPESNLQNTPSKDIVWLDTRGPGGGGGGGGNKTPEPPKKAELPGKEKVTVPAVKPPEVAPQPPKKEEPKPEQNLNIPAQTLANSDQPLPGVIETVADAAIPSQGPGTGGGAGTGRGPGIGEGDGSGLGPGYGGGTGGGAFRPGNGVETPRLLVQVKPQYTADAMRAKVQGVVVVEAVVLPDGTVGNVKIVRSLDQTFGLDEEALKAAKKWRFVPGTRFGRPVSVLVSIELAFTLR